MHEGAQALRDWYAGRERNGRRFFSETPVVFTHALCPALSDAEIRRRFGDTRNKVEVEKKENRAFNGNRWTVAEYLDRYRHPTMYYLVADLPPSWLAECDDLGLVSRTPVRRPGTVLTC